MRIPVNPASGALSLILLMVFAVHGYCDEVDDLILELGSSETYIRVNAVDQLGNIGGEKATAAVISALGDDESWVRSSALRALGRMKDRSAVPAIKAMLGDDEAYIRSSALYTLQDLDALPDCEELIRLSLDEDPGFRSTLAGYLGENCPDLAFHRLMEMADDSEPSVGAAAVRALAGTGDPDAAGVVLPLLGSGDVALRSSALDYFKTAGFPGYADAIKPLLDDRDSGVRMKAAAALEASGWQPADIYDKARLLFAGREWDELLSLGGVATDILVGGLGDADFGVTGESAKLLQKLGWKPVDEADRFVFGFALKDWDGIADMEGVEERLGEVLTDPARGAEAREAAAEGLGSTGTGEAAGILVSSIGSLDGEKDMMIVYAVGDAIKSLGATAFPEVFGLFEGAGNCGMMLDMMAETDEDKSREDMSEMMDSMKGLMTVMGLVEAMGEAAAPYLADGLSNPDPSVRCNCLFLLSMPGGPRDGSYVMPMVSDPDPDVRATALISLTTFDDIDLEEAETPILAAMEDENLRVRYAATVALGKLKTDKAVEMLIGISCSPDPSTRRLAAAGLGESGDPRAVPALAKLAKDPVEGVSSFAVMSLSSIDDMSSSEALAGIFNDGAVDIRARTNALMALSRHENPKAAEVMAGAALSEDRLIRLTLYRVLPSSKVPEKLSLLVQGLSDVSAEVRATCAYGIGSANDESGVPPLVSALNDPSRQVRSAAVQSLGIIGGPDAIEAVTALVYESSDDSLRSQALFALGYSGDPQARAALEQMAASDDEFISEKARVALDSAKARDKIKNMPRE